MVFDAVMDCMRCTSIHFEWAFTRTKYMCPKNGPAKSRCNLCHGWGGHFHGCNGATAGDGQDSWQFLHCFTTSSTAAFICAWSLDIASGQCLHPGCKSCSSFSTNCWPWPCGETTTSAGMLIRLVPIVE